MPTVPENAPSSTTAPIGVDCEPDDAWKEQLKKRIKEGLWSMVVDAKENYATELSKAPDTPEARMRLEVDYKEAMLTINGLASEQYKLELDRERNQRRWAAGVPMTPGWSQYFHEEQQNIMNSIKQSNQTDNSVRTATESPTEDRSSAIPKSQSVRRGSDVRSTLSGGRDDPGSFRRSHRASVHERPVLPENCGVADIVEEPEELIRSPPPPRARLSSTDRPSLPSRVSPDNRWGISLGRSSGSIHSSEHRARSPPPEVWKSAPAEDALLVKHYNLGRRGSAASMRSTGSAASIRPSVTVTIPEQADDDESDESAIDSIEENDYERVQETTEQGRTSWISTNKSHEKEKQPHLRGNSRSPVDAGLRSDNLGSSSLRSGDRHRPIDSPGKPPSYYDYREQSSSHDNYAHRHLQVPSQDPGPIPARSSYINEKDYGPLHFTPHRPKPPPYHPQLESRPISRQVSFTLDLDDDNDEEEIDRGGRDRERHLDREYDRREEDTRKEEEIESFVDAGLRSDNIGSSSLRSDDRHRAPPYYNREQSSSRDNYAPRDRKVPSQDPGPITARSSYGDERDYGPQHSTPHGPKPPPYHPQLESRPISRQVSFTRQPHADLDDDDDEREIDRGGRRGRERRLDREYNRREEDVRRKEEEIWRMEEEVKRKEEDVRKKEEEIWRMEGEVKRKEEDVRKKEEEIWRIEEAKRKEEEAKRKEEDARKKEEEIWRKEEEVKRKKDARKKEEEIWRKKEEEVKRKKDARKKEEEIWRKEEEVKRNEEDVRKKGEEIWRMEEEAKRKEEDARKKEEEIWRKEEEVKQKEDDVRKKEEEIWRKEEEVKRKEEDARKKEEDIWRMEEEVKRKEEDAARKAKKTKKMEAVVMKKEADVKRKEKELRIKEEDAKRKEEAARLDSPLEDAG